MCNVSFECAIHAWCVRLGACGLCNQKVHSEVARLPWHKIRFFKNGTWLQHFRNQCNCSPKGILEIPTVLAGPIRKESALHPHPLTLRGCHKFFACELKALLRVLRAETRLTVYRPCQFGIRLGLVAKIRQARRFLGTAEWGPWRIPMVRSTLVHFEVRGPENDVLANSTKSVIFDTKML